MVTGAVNLDALWELAVVVVSETLGESWPWKEMPWGYGLTQFLCECVCVCVCVWEREESWYMYVGCKSRNVVYIPCLEIVPCSGKWTANYVRHFTVDATQCQCILFSFNTVPNTTVQCWFMHTLNLLHHTFSYCMLYLHSEWGIVQTNVTVLLHLQINIRG